MKGAADPMAARSRHCIQRDHGPVRYNEQALVERSACEPAVSAVGGPDPVPGVVGTPRHDAAAPAAPDAEAPPGFELLLTVQLDGIVCGR